MAVEIERKFLLKDPEILKKAYKKLSIKQAYLSATSKQTTRIRLVDDGEEKTGKITIKSKPDSKMLARTEFEYDIPYDDALEMFKMGVSYIKKDRYLIKDKIDKEIVWEVDIFKDANKGLMLVEVEIPNADYAVKIPSWVGKEVTQNPELNSNRKLSLNNIKKCPEAKKEVEKDIKKSEKVRKSFKV